MSFGGREDFEMKRLKQSQVLAFNFDHRTKSVAIVVCQDRIEQVLLNQGEDSVEKPYHRQALKELTDDTIYVFASFIRHPGTGLQFLACIDKKCMVHIYLMSDL